MCGFKHVVVVEDGRPGNNNGRTTFPMLGCRAIDRAGVELGSGGVWGCINWGGWEHVVVVFVDVMGCVEL